MVVCIAEKPSVAREIANVLGAKSQRDGYLEGNGYQVTWTFGHLCELKEPHEYTPMWKSWSLSALPMIPPRFGIKLKQDKGVEKQFRIIESLMQKADEIINCGDAGQEGELIQRWVMQKAAAKCPVKRLWVNSLTEEAIKEGFQTLKDQSAYQGLYEAGLMRAIGDWLLGMNATRLYTQKYAAGKRQVLSVGRVQTPTLALVVARQREIDNFVPRQSWVLSTLYRDTKFNAIERDEEAEAEDAAAVAAAAEKGKKQKSKGIIYKPLEYATEAEGKAIIDSIKDQPFTVLSVEKKKGTEASPRLYDLTGLQVDCNKKLGLSAEQTLSIIQSLYEKKVTTYPRVDTTFLPDDVYPKCPQTMNGLYQTKFAGVAPYADLIRPLGGKPLRKSKKVFDNSKVTDHHAIIPTGIIPGGLTELEQKVFDLVARAFIAAFYDECKFETTTVMGEVKRDEGTPILFRTTGKVIIDEGWRVVMASANPLSKGDKPAEQEVSPSRGELEGSFEKGESGPHVPSISEKWTTPPKPYTDATLLRAMETAGKTVEDEELRDALKENGIGRPSTRAAIIETLIRRHYIRRERSSLHPTPTGFELIDLIHYDLLKSAELTGRWEKKLRQIERHEYEARTFLDELKQMVSDIVIAVLREKKTADIQ
ncbi:MAG: DNA topoisomerase 3 [Bacteroidaceae bacterium]|nr:DNA topoisomerase 3 [Bacteroidaceae bacterium]